MQVPGVVLRLPLVVSLCGSASCFGIWYAAKLLLSIIASDWSGSGTVRQQKEEQTGLVEHASRTKRKQEGRNKEIHGHVGSNIR